MASWNTVEGKADVRVADAAARNLHDNLIRAGAEYREFARPQRRLGSHQLESICALHTHGCGAAQSSQVNQVRKCRKLAQ